MTRLSPPQTQEDAEATAAGIERCVAALEDLPRLRDEVGGLRHQTNDVAIFAAALFDLERARRGDPDARAQIGEVADSLLVYWRERTGDALADTHPALEPLWAHASELLVSFEVRRFKAALDACWKSRSDAEALQQAIEGLKPAGNRRVEFAACLYHLELARLGVASSRAAFARRAGLVQEAYLARDVALELVGDDLGLRHLWSELIPYLDEFFDSLEEEAVLRTERGEFPQGWTPPKKPEPRQELDTDPHGERLPSPALLGGAPDEPTFTGAPAITPVRPALGDLSADPTLVGLKQNRLALETTEPQAEPLEPGAMDKTQIRAQAIEDSTLPRGQAIETLDATPPGGLPLPPSKPRSDSASASGVFDLWLKEPVRGERPAIVESMEEVEPEPELDAEAATPTAPPRARPPPPPNFTPVPGRLDQLLAAEPTAPRPPPPPPNFTPPPGPPNDSGILDLKDVVEETPAPRRRQPSLDIDPGDYQPDEAAMTFWRHTENALGLLPPAEAPRMDRRALSADGRAERKKLTTWLDGVHRRFDTVPESRAFACLMRLYLAAQLKEKGLFGGVNAKRKAAFKAAFELLSPEPLAAGHCAVWFELDGKETLEQLNGGLEVLTDYLQFCARQNLDPLDPQVPDRFLG